MRFSSGSPSCFRPSISASPPGSGRSWAHFSCTDGQGPGSIHPPFPSQHFSQDRTTFLAGTKNGVVLSDSIHLKLPATNRGTATLRNALTVDVEDYYQVSAF